MVWVNLVTLLAVLQFFWFAYLVGRARVKFGVAAPAITGHVEFERYFRVQQNTLETLIMFLPALWIAGQYWNTVWIPLVGVVYLIGRVVYMTGYVRDPHSRSWGYALSIAPVGVLILFGLVGIARAIFNA